MLNLVKNIISEQLLTEGRKEKAIDLWLSKISNPNPQTRDAVKSIVDGISDNDPSGNNKYLEWMVDLASTPGLKDFSLSRMYELVGKYHKNLEKITPNFINDLTEVVDNSLQGGTNWVKILKNPKDIKSFLKIGDLANFLYYLEGYKSKSELKKEKGSNSVRLFDNDDILVISPKSEEASCKYGAGTRWCTASRIENHFGYYNSKGVLFYLLPKMTDQKLAIFIPYKQTSHRFLNFDVYDEEDNHLQFETINQALDLVFRPYIKNGEFKRPDPEVIDRVERLILDHHKQMMNN